MPARRRLPTRAELYRSRRSRMLAVSVLVHLLLALVVLLFLHRRKLQDLDPGGPQISMVFEGESGGAPPSPVSSPAPPIGTAPATPPGEAAPESDAEPEVNAPIDLPLPPLPPAPRAMLPRPALRAPPRPRRASPLSSPQAYSFGRPAAPPPMRAGRPREVNMGFAIPNPARTGPPGGAGTGDFDVEQTGGPPLGRDWFAQLAAFWREHRYYPEQARESGEDGLVGLQLVVDEGGRVRSVEVQTRSGSTWLDAAALSVFRNAKLPPFPPGAEGGDATIGLRINYILTRN